METLTEEWIALALLHKEHPDRPHFTFDEVDERVAEEFDQGEGYPLVDGLRNNAGIANEPRIHWENPPNRYFFKPAPGIIRLFKLGDKTLPSRSSGNTYPKDEIPEPYRHLRVWYLEWVGDRLRR